MKILVMGAGAVGAYYGARLAQAGEDVVFCARGENLRAMQERGLEITSIRGDLKLDKVAATANPRQFAPYDLILLDGAAEIIPQTLGRQLKSAGRLVGVYGGSPRGKATIYRVIEGQLVGRPIFDAAAPVLPGFVTPPAFVF